MSPYEGQRVRYYGHLTKHYSKLGTIERVINDQCDVRLDNKVLLLNVLTIHLADATVGPPPATVDPSS